MESHPLSMREALGSIPSVSMHPEAVALSHGWFGGRQADSPWNLGLAGEVPGIIGCLAGATSGRHLAGTRDFTLPGQVPGQLARTNICTPQLPPPALPCRRRASQPRARRADLAAASASDKDRCQPRLLKHKLAEERQRLSGWLDKLHLGVTPHTYDLPRSETYI